MTLPYKEFQQNDKLKFEFPINRKRPGIGALSVMQRGSRALQSYFPS